MLSKILGKSSKYLGVIIVSVMIFVIIMFNEIFVTVQYGQIGVKIRFGAVSGAPLNPGLHVKFPFAEKIVTYRTQKIVYETSDNPLASNADYTDRPVNTTTQDGQVVDIRYTVRFSIRGDKVKQVAETLGTEEEVVEKIVKTDSRINVRNIAREFLAENLYSGDVREVEKSVLNTLEPIFTKNGLILDEFGIRGITFSEEYQLTIESKQLEKERIQIEEYKADQEKFRKEQKITIAEAEAEAQRLQQKTLNKDLLQKLWIEKWDGKLPNVSSGGSNGLIYGLPSK